METQEIQTAFEKMLRKSIIQKDKELEEVEKIIDSMDTKLHPKKLRAAIIQYKEIITRIKDMLTAELINL